MNACALPPLYFMLPRAYLCLSCEAIFEATERCPACASEEVWPLGKLVEAVR